MARAGRGPATVVDRHALRIAFAGTPDFAATILAAIADSEHEVALVISQPDARRGRGRRLSPPPVAELARELSLQLEQPERISELDSRIAECDALVVAAYGQILRSSTLTAAANGAWNVHASLLPAYRGAAPIERAVMAGKPETGVSIMQMDEGLDTGPVALTRSVEIPVRMNAGELTEELARLGAAAIVEALDLLERGELTTEPQDGSRATYAEKLTAAETSLDWHRPAPEVHDHVRALAPRPGARTFHDDYDGPIKVLATRLPEEDRDEPRPGEPRVVGDRLLVGCGSGAVELLELQLPGKRALPTREVLRGNKFAGGFRADTE